MEYEIEKENAQTIIMMHLRLELQSSHRYIRHAGEQISGQAVTFTGTACNVNPQPTEGARRCLGGAGPCARRFRDIHDDYCRR
jgi:hypothetical protein